MVQCRSTTVSKPRPSDGVPPFGGQHRVLSIRIGMMASRAALRRFFARAAWAFRGHQTTAQPPNMRDPHRVGCNEVLPAPACRGFCGHWPLVGWGAAWNPDREGHWLLRVGVILRGGSARDRGVPRRRVFVRLVGRWLSLRGWVPISVQRHGRPPPDAGGRRSRRSPAAARGLSQFLICSVEAG